MVNVYTDTSVIGGCFDLEFQEWSLALFDEFKAGAKKMIISDIVLSEISEARKEIQSKLWEIPEDQTTVLKTTATVMHLARTYIEEGALSNKCYFDALHIALATINNAEVLASWNFKHIVNLDRIRLYNSINLRMGYRLIEIRTPREILNIKDHEKS